MIIPNYELSRLCIKRSWFTSGSISQYEKLFQANSDGWSIERLAIIIYICSSGEWTVDSIVQELKAASAAYADMMCPDEREDW